MTRSPAKARLPVPVAPPPCPRNDDCDRQRADAATRLVEHLDHLFGPPGADPDDHGPAMTALITIGEIGGKWLRFCAFVRKWFPRLWVFLPLVAGALFKGSSEATDALIQAVTLFLQSQTGG